MPVNIIGTALMNGPDSIPGYHQAITYGPILVALGAIKYYFKGSVNTSERDLHGKVYIVTGGTSGLGAELVKELAVKGAQIILLVRSIEDAWLVEYIDDLRSATNNFMIYAEMCDLNSLYSIRKFATKWLDNQPPRRLDGVVCCAADCIPMGKSRQVTEEGIEKQLGINYLAHYHLLTLLAPSIRSQPPDRDVRLLLTSCATQSLGQIDMEDLLYENKRYSKNLSYKLYGTSKLLLGLFGKEFQKRCLNYQRKDNLPCNVHVSLVNPGMMRTPSTRRFLSMGSIWGLIMYVILYPIWFLFFKSTSDGIQSLLFTLFSPVFLQNYGFQLVAECKIIAPSRKEFADEELQQDIYDKTEKIIERLEKQSAIERKKASEKGKTKEQLLKESKERHLAELKRKQDITEKPNTVDELQAKLGFLRQQIAPDLPLFPEDDVKVHKTKAKKRK